MALSPDHLEALINLRVCELRELAAWTAVKFWELRPRPTLADRYFPNLPRYAKMFDREALSPRRRAN